MKIAVMSDIHGNTLALDAVLKDIKEKKCDAILCLGDLMLAGYDANGVVEKFVDLKKNSNYQIEIIQGNTDLLLTHPIPDGFDRIYSVAPCMAYAYREDLKDILKNNLNFVSQFETTKELEIGGVKIFMCHGSPRAVDENIYSDITPDELEVILEGVDVDVVFCGHTHIPCGFQLESGKMLVNVGSVGRPMTVEKEACYVLMDINEEKGEYGIEHIFVPYNINKAAEKIIKRGFEGCETLAKMVEG
ncbi:MAG: metallophosphoesterase family protein [Cyanobacteria bacterium SIG30]|nr:metallophosphoesterase family protein [Cyanobacteria bacterium SIG30]